MLQQHAPAGLPNSHHASISGEEFLHWDTLGLGLTLPELSVSWEPAWVLASFPQPLQGRPVEHPHRHGSLQSDSMSLHARPSGLVCALCRGRGSIPGKEELREAQVLQRKPKLISHFRFRLWATEPFLSHPSCFWLKPTCLSAWHLRHSLSLSLLWVPLKGASVTALGF